MPKIAINEESKKHRERLNKRKVELIGFISFLMGFSQAFVLYVMSTYFRLASGSENLSLFYFLAYAVVLLMLINLHKIIRSIGRANVFYFSLMAKIIVIFLLAIYPPSIWTIGLLIIYIISGNLEWVSLDVILESFSLDNMSGRIRGKHLTFLNAGFLFGPFLSTKILENYGYGGVFAVLLIFNALIFSLALIGLKDANHKFFAQETTRELLKKVMKRKNILRVYGASFALEFFFALTVIYVPLYLTDIGFSWGDIGIILTVMLLPFVFLQYLTGYLADKRLGEKELIIASLVIMFFSSLALYFIATKSIFIWSIVLFSGRIGAAILEVMRDSYFYKRIDGRDVDLIDFFRTAMPSAFIVASAITLPLLSYFPIKTTFLVVAVAVLAALWPVFRLEDNKCERELAAKAAVNI